MGKHSARRAFGLTVLGVGLVAMFGLAQAQVGTERQVLPAGSYRMPLGMDLTNAPFGPPAPREEMPRLSPVDKDELLRQKSARGEPTPSAVESSIATARDPEPAAVLTNCVTNTATTSTPSDIHGAAGPTNLVVVTNVDIG